MESCQWTSYYFLTISLTQSFSPPDRYTTLDPGESATCLGDHHHHDRAVIIALATLLAIFSLLLLIIIIWLCLKRNSSATGTQRTPLTSSNKWGGATRDRDSSIPTRDPRDSGLSSPLSPSVAPHSLPPPSRPDSNYHPGDGPWSTSSVGGPGIHNMTGIGASARNSNVMSTHHGDPMHSTSQFATSQGDLADPHGPGPYLNPNREGRPRI